MKVFQILTPLTYCLLIGLWVYILWFLLQKLRRSNFEKNLLNVLIIILAIDALRTLFESIYFGAWFSSKSGFLPIGVYDFLSRPEIVIIPKLLNVVAAVLIIGILLYRWFPAEKRDRELQEKIVKEHTRKLSNSEERFRLIFENAPVLMNSFSEEGKCLLWNKQCRETFGWTIDEVNAHSDPLALFYPDPMVRARAAKSVTKDPDGHFKEWQPLTKDGRTLTTTWANFRLPSGMVFSLGHDITELKQTREALLKEKNRLQFALEVCHTGAWDLNLKDHSSYRTAGHDRIFGYENPLTEWTYEMFLEHVVPEDREETDRKFQHAIAHQCDWNFECRIRRQDGEIRWIWAVGRHGSPVDGNQNFMVGVVQDITERKQTEVELQKAHDSLERRVMERTSELKIRQEEAEALNRAMINVLQDLKLTNSELENAKSALLTSNKELEAFSYSVSHDLRAPLRAINGFVEILLEDYGEQLDTEGKRVCAVISDSAHDMGKLIDDLLSFSRIGRVALQPQEVDMEALVRNVYSELSTNENPQRIDFRVDPLPTAVGDPTLLRQVWINLIGNAVKFSSKKEQALIEVRAEPLADEIVYSIRDNGAGFDPQYADKLFGVFQRLHSTEEFEGTGVGLAIVQHIVQRHGGRTWAKAKPDEGATIYFTLKKENNHDKC